MRGWGLSEAKLGFRVKLRTESPGDVAWKTIDTMERTAGASKLIRRSLHALFGFRAELGAL